MIKIYDKENRYIRSVESQKELAEFMFDNEYKYPEVYIYINGNKELYRFDDAEFEFSKMDLLRKSEFFHMSKICLMADVDYYLFNLWKNKGIFNLSHEDVEALHMAMDNVCK